MEIVDFHTHSTCSDGLLTPVELVRHAAERGVRYLSIADHDSVEAYANKETYAAAEQYGIVLIPGIEISTIDDQNNKFHVLGLQIDPDAAPIHDLIARERASRITYANRLGSMFRESGWNIGDPSSYAGGVVTKAHIADAILANPANQDHLYEQFGSIPTRGQFIEQLMNFGCPFYVERDAVDPYQAARTIHAAGGIAILAHPVANLLEGGSDERLIYHMVSGSFDGIEAFYMYYSKSQADRRVDMIGHYTNLAKRYGLYASAGSDFHGVSSAIGKYVDVGFSGEASRPGKDFYTDFVAARMARLDSLAEAPLL